MQVLVGLWPHLKTAKLLTEAAAPHRPVPKGGGCVGCPNDRMRMRTGMRMLTMRMRMRMRVRMRVRMPKSISMRMKVRTKMRVRMRMRVMGKDMINVN